MADTGNSGGTLDGAAVDPADFARSIASTPDDQLAAGMNSELRTMILDEIFKRMDEHFDGSKAAGVEAVIDWVILDRPDGGADRYQVKIAGGACAVTKEPTDTPRVTFKVKPVQLLKLVTGNA